jgi:predicted transcriptional regulator
MGRPSFENLSRRERQIMAVVFARGQATVSEVLGDLPDPPSRTSVRTLLRILEEKGHVKHSERGREYVYEPVAKRRRVGESAFRHVLETFFGGSLENAVSAYLSGNRKELTAEELARLSDLIEQAKKKGR